MVRLAQNTTLAWYAVRVRLERSLSPPCEGGVRGGGPGGIVALYAGPELLGLAELPAWPSMFVMPCPPPLTPPSQVGERARQLALSFHRAPKTPPRGGRTVSSFSSPRAHTSGIIQLAAYQPPATKRRAAPPAAEAAPDPAAAEEARELRSFDRFLSLLERNPRRGTALDRVYGYHVERGSLDAFIKSYQDRLAKNPKDGAGWLILGLLEGQRGQDAAAVAALQTAETSRPDDPLPSFYLGQSLVLVGQPEQAAAAFERSLERKPARNDLLEIFQALGRVYQRTQKNDQALQVWNRLEALFPNDLRVQEQIASALAEENQPDQTLPRFEALSTKATDPFRQVQFAMQAADLKVRLGQTDQALRDFESMLAKLRPDSWLHREIRRRIEEVFLRNDDQAGPVSYYEGWTKKEPDDIEALVRLGRTLVGMGRAAEAQAWYEKAIKLAPTRRDLRLALISQLSQDQKYAEATAQYEALDQADPNNPDTLRDWGALVLRDATKPLPERKAAASAIWRKLLQAKPNDPVATAQVADLLRQAEMVDDSLALYRKAIELAPNNAQYREYLGEYFHNLKRPDEAKAAWAKIADGANKNAKNLTRLAEVLAGFGYVKDAVTPLTEAVDQEKDDFSLRLALAGYLTRLERNDEAEAQLAVAGKLAERDEEKIAVLEARVKNDQAASRLAARIEGMTKQLEKAPDAAAEEWIALARYFEADMKLPEAVRAADKATELDPRSVRAWTLAARVRESAGSLGDSADALRRLADIDRRNRTEHLTGIARIESRLGRTDAALKAGRDLLAAAPGNADNYEFFAQLCFQLGRTEEGIDALRRAVRANPNDTKIILTLADTLAGQYQTDEAIEIYWRAFDRTEDLDHKLDVVRKLAELYLQKNQFDRLLTRLQHQERDERAGAVQIQPRRQRDVALCTAQALATAGDLGGARSELERLLASNTRDTHLLQQLSKLSEEEYDLDAAARYQKQLNELAPSDDGLTRLGQLYWRAGELDEAQALWAKLASGKGEGYRVYQAMDVLLADQKPQPVLEITESLVRKDPRDWEALYRYGAALAALDKSEEAVRRFQTLLDLSISDDDKSAFNKAKARNPKLTVPGASASARMMQPALPLEERVSNIHIIRIFSKLDKTSISRQITFSPTDFGQARMAALAWLMSLAENQGAGKSEAVIAAFRKAAGKSPADLRSLWDWFYLCAVRLDNAGAFEAAKALNRAAPTDTTALWAYLYCIGGRGLPPGQSYYVYQDMPARDDDASPLDKDELAASRQFSRPARAPARAGRAAQIVVGVDAELKRAQQVVEQERFYRDALAGADRFEQVVGLFMLASRRGDVDGLIQLNERYDRLQTGRTVSYVSNSSFYFVGADLAMGQGMTALADKKEYADLLRLLDYNLATVRRKNEHQSPGAAARALRARYQAQRPGYSPSYAIWIGSDYRSVPLAFPMVSEYLDRNTIAVLRTAFELYKRDDLLSDLIAHYRRQIQSTPTPADAIYPRLALSSILWWNGETEEAIAELTKVVDASRAESDLRLDLAGLLEEQGDFAEALTLVDARQPLDNFVLRRREELALRVAQRSGDVERARQAAERLFGLRLDIDTQMSLAPQMYGLGLHELAEAILGRARGNAGNRVSALLGLLTQYQRQEKRDAAAQIAMQILRSTSSSRQANAGATALRTAPPARARPRSVSWLGRVNFLA